MPCPYRHLLWPSKQFFRVANVTRTCRLICTTKLNWNACWLLSFQYCVESHEYKQQHQTENCKETLPRKHAEIKYEKNKLQKRTELKPTTYSRGINSNTKARRLPLLTAHLWGLPRTHHNRPRVHIWSLPLVTSTPRHKRNLKREDWDDNHRLIVFLAQYRLPKSAASKWKMTNLEYFICAWVYVHKALDHPPPPQKFNNYTLITVEQEPEEINSKVYDLTWRKKPLVERPTRTLEIGCQPDSLDHILPSVSVS